MGLADTTWPKTQWQGACPHMLTAPLAGMTPSAGKSYSAVSALVGHVYIWETLTLRDLISADGTQEDERSGKHCPSGPVETHTTSENGRLFAAQR